MSHLSARQPMTLRRHKPDYGLVLVMGLLLLIGLIVIYSIGPALEQNSGIAVTRQFVAIGIGSVLFLLTSRLPLTFWHRAQPLLILASLVTSLMLFFDFLSPEIKGAQRWINLGPLSFQPSELLKFTLIIYVATFLSRRARHNQLNDPKQTAIPMAVVLAVLGLFVAIFQRDLGTMLVIAAIMMTMLFTSGLRLKHFTAIVGGLVGAGIGTILVAPHRMARLGTFLDPAADPTGAGYHINQALIAIGSGGFFGLGLGRSIMANGYLPEAGNDSVFAIYGEKFGFLGATIILALFGLLLVRMLRIVDRAPNLYTKLLAAGIFGWIFSHVLINVGAMLSLIPLTGITLPFLSYGGSSLLVIMAGLGLMFNISRYTNLETSRRGESYANSADRRRNRRARVAYSGRSL